MLYATLSQLSTLIKYQMVNSNLHHLCLLLTGRNWETSHWGHELGYTSFMCAASNVQQWMLNYKFVMDEKNLSLVSYCQFFLSSDICLTLKNYKIFTIKNFLIYSTHFIVGISIPSTENFLVLFGSRSSGFNVINWMVPAPSLVSYISYNERNCVQQPKMITS